ncbi:uncharacterized protein LOC121850055 [Callorhinchus milii]|uniref:uncharacterized protein LOC121850055 n=1 Tax=Callorhinchus milii TaxID=7868 RepID=UPI001C3F60D4|nr:uncharacterized protein LOC121850055 [Callorhinchus milii]
MLGALAFSFLVVLLPCVCPQGLFLLTQPEDNKTLNQYEAFGVKVEKEEHYVHSGTDVTLSCSISRLPDGVSLQWKHRESTQHNSGNSTEQLLINNTLYLIVRHVRGDGKQKYMCEVQDNGSTVLAADMDFEVNTYEFDRYTIYRSNTNHSELHLICKYNYPGYKFTWKWKPVHSYDPETQIASGYKDQNINIIRTHFGERLRPATTLFNGKDFTMHIVPVMFEDAGTYTCVAGTRSYATVKLITVKVTVDTGTGGASTNLICSVSEVTETVRLVWMGNDSKTFITEKTLKAESQEEKSLSLSVQGADGGTWTCVLFHQNSPRVAIPYYLEPSGSTNRTYFLDRKGNFKLIGSDVQGNGPVMWRWKPHSEESTDKTLMTFTQKNQQWELSRSNTYDDVCYLEIQQESNTFNVQVTNLRYECAGWFLLTQPENNKTLNQYEAVGVKVERNRYPVYSDNDVT